MEEPYVHSSWWSALKRHWPEWLIALIAFVNGLIDILRVLLTRFPENPFYGYFLPFGAYFFDRTLTVILGFMLIYLSFQLLQRRRIAWWLATIASGIAMLLRFIELQFLFNIPLLTFILLLIFYQRFTVHSERRSIQLGVLTLVLILVVVIAYGTIGFWLLDRRAFGVSFNLWEAFISALREFALLGNSDLTPRTRYDLWFIRSLNVFGILAGLFAIYSLFRPVSYRLITVPGEQALARRILERNGHSSYEYYKLYPAKSYFFSNDRRCFIAYRTALSIALCLGDPAGPDEQCESTLRNFILFCSDNGWNIALMLADNLPVYQSLGFHLLKIGEEAIVDLDRFVSQTVKRREFHRSLLRFDREGYTCFENKPSYSSAFMDELEEISDEWLSLPGRSEHSFAEGKFERSYLNQMVIYTLKDPSGRLVAFFNTIPSFVPGLCTGDLIRHRLQIPHGLADYFMIKLLLLLKERDCKNFSLGIAPLAGIGARPGARLEERIVHQGYEHLNRFYSFKGLRYHKAKFEPEWKDRFLVYRGGLAGLARTFLAFARLTN